MSPGHLFTDQSHISLLINSDRRSSELASNEEAWQEAREENGINSSLTFPSDQLVWARASTRDSILPMHIEGDSFATSIRVVTRLQYWVLARAHRDDQGNIDRGDLGSIRAFEHFSPYDCPLDWELEGVLIGPGRQGTQTSGSQDPPKAARGLGRARGRSRGRGRRRGRGRGKARDQK